MLLISVVGTQKMLWSNLIFEKSKLSSDVNLSAYLTLKNWHIITTTNEHLLVVQNSIFKKIYIYHANITFFCKHKVFTYCIN